jgi:hypothetical protein
MNQDLTAAPLREETEKVIPMRPRSVRDDWTSVALAEITYIAATDLDRPLPQQRSSRRGFERESFRALGPGDRIILNLAFDRISQALQTDFQMAELSNCFDEWRDLLEAASRKVGSFTSSHRKILGSLLTVVGGKDISDFDIEILRIFRDATNILRLPRTSRQDARRIIAELLKRRKKIMMPLGIEESENDKVQVLDNMIDRLILKSSSDQ